MRKIAMVLGIVASTGVIFLSGTAAAQANVDWGVTISSGTPPPPRHETSPAPRPQHVWVTGFWNWRDGVYIWIPGHWERARYGYGYVQPEWREGPRGWQLNQGGWRRGYPDAVQNDHPPREHQDHRGNCPPGHRKKGEC